MKNSQLAWLLGGALVLSSGGLGVAACSSSSGSGNPSGGNDSGTGSDGTGGGNDTGTGNDTGNGGNDTGPVGDGGPGNDCGSTPSLHPGDGGSIYCPFGPDGSALHCAAATQECCIGGKIGTNQFAESNCETWGTACTNPADGGRQLECGEALDCTGNNHGTTCCATGALPAIKAGCGYYAESPGLKGSTCSAAACAAGQFQMCATDAECGAGKTCTPFKTLGMQLGFCQ